MSLQHLSNILLALAKLESVPEHEALMVIMEEAEAKLPGFVGQVGTAITGMLQLFRSGLSSPAFCDLLFVQWNRQRLS